MGYIAHDAVIVTGPADYDSARIESFREALPEKFRHLLVGPIRSAVNSYATWIFAPDGSKEGWDDSDECEALRKAFVDLFRPESPWDGSAFDVVSVRYGGDYSVECGVSATALSDD